MQNLTKNRKSLIFLYLLCLMAHGSIAQDRMPQRLIYSAKITFQSYGLPFKNIAHSFKNMGGAIGIDYAYNAGQTLFQSVTLGIQHHSEHERIVYVNTQLAYRPLLFKVLEPGLAIGIGRAIALSNPKNPYYEVDKGAWKKSSHQQQGHWQVPLSLSMGYRTKLPNGTIVTPYVGYEASPIIKYNSAFALLPYSLLSVGTRIRFAAPSKEN